jgi:hypothetical protein
MVGKWYKYLGVSDKFVTKFKWYKFLKEDQYYWDVLDNENQEKNPMSFAKRNIEKHFDLSNPMDHNPDEVKEEVKEPDFKIETITIVVINDEKYITNTVFDLKQLVKHLKEVTYRLDKQIDENT